MLQTGGYISVGNRIIPGGKNGAIYSGEYIELLPGFEIQSGSEVYLDVKDMHCSEGLDNTMSEPYFFPATKPTEPTEELDISDNLHDTSGTPTYNLLGQPVDETYHGIVIQGGKKRVQ